MLVVDDEPVNREIIGRALEHRGHSWAGAGSAEEAETLLRSRDFDLVLLDLVLPGLTGLQALSPLGKLSRAPIWIMSGHTDRETRADALALGAAGFFPKPLEMAELAEAIAALPERA